MSDPILIDSLDFANQRRHMAGAIAFIEAFIVASIILPMSSGLG